MMNTLRGAMGSLKSEDSSSCTNMQPSSPTDSSKKMVISDNQMESSLTPPSLNFPSVKFELNGGVEVQSPDNSIWETLYSDHLDGDYMISSPVNLASPGTLHLCNYVHGLQGQSVLGYSPPRFSPLFNQKPRGQSPLHKVFNSPSYNHFMQIDGGSSLPAIEEFLDENYQRDNGYGEFSIATAVNEVFDETSIVTGTTSEVFDELNRNNNNIMPQTTMFPNQSTGLANGCDRERQDNTIYDQAGGMRSFGSSTSLSQQLQHEHQQEKQQAQGTVNLLEQNNLLHHTVTVNPRMVPITSEQEQDSGLQLVHLLLACAETVAKEDYMLARRYLNILNRVVTPLGDAMQRVASCFTEALSVRLAAAQSTTVTTSSSSSSSASSSSLMTAPKPLSPFPPNPFEILKIYQIVYQACPYVKFAHFTANQAIFEAFEAEERVHIIDLDILQGYQWPAFMQALAAKPHGAPFLRITGVGSSIESVLETGRCLTELAHTLHIPFEFHPVGEQLEDIKPHMFNRMVGEALAVNSVNRLHRVPGHCLGNLLAMLRDQAPNIVTIVEQEASHNGPYFLGRFLEALHYYSAIFDSLDATFPPDSAQRAKVEQYIFGPEIMNIVACEGNERIERHERLEKWRKIMEGRGFKGVQLSANAVTQSKILLGLYSCDGYRLTEDKGCLLLGWQDRAILSASAWRC